MRSARSALIAPVTAAVLLLAAPSARAGTITVDFDLTSSTVALLGGILNIPPDGSITAASAQVTVQGSNLTSPSAGAAQLSNLMVMATINGTVGSSVLLTGTFSGTQLGGGAGSLSGGLANLIVATLTLNVNGLVNCFGGLCGALGTFPISAVNSVSVLTGFGSMGIGGLGTLGAATLNGLLPLTIGGNTMALSLVGQEVNRTFVIPEPNTFALVGLGVLGLAGLGWRRTRPR
jgi:hypothetical protein